MTRITIDDIKARLLAASHECGLFITHRTAEVTYGRWDPRQALDAVIEEVSEILAEMAESSPKRDAP
jgi:hypothetical protein